MCLDELRRARPGLGFALYAIEPDGRVSLEVHDAGQVYTFEGPTAAAAITAAFPELASQNFDTPIERDDSGDADEIPHMLRRVNKTLEQAPTGALGVRDIGAAIGMDPITPAPEANIFD